MPYLSLLLTRNSLPQIRQHHSFMLECNSLRVWQLVHREPMKLAHIIRRAQLTCNWLDEVIMIQRDNLNALFNRIAIHVNAQQLYHPNLNPKLLPYLTPHSIQRMLACFQKATGQVPVTFEWLDPALDQQHASILHN